jgi:hypothetical protein
MMQRHPGLEWLSQAAALQVCPLCVAARGHEQKYLRDLCQSLAHPGQQVVEFARAPGLCPDHLTKFEDDVLNDSDLPGPDAVELYIDTLQDLAVQLSELEQDGWLQIAECPVCAYRDHELIATAHTFMAAVANVPFAVGETLQAGGLCVGHFVLTWVSSEESANRNLLRDIQFRATLDRIARLRQLGQAGSSTEAVQETPEAWKRAGRFLSGWTMARR